MKYLLILALLSLAAGAAPVGHSHNDYQQSEPFGLAARAGMGSVEADIYPVAGKLLVAHGRGEIDPRRDLGTLYLNPLEDWPGKPLELVVDIKADPDQALPLLEQLLQAHPQAHLSAVILTGARPSRPPSLPLITLEGTVAEMQAGTLPPHCHYVSGPWSSEFSWQGDGPIPAGERDRLDRLVSEAHQLELSLRLWGAPDTPASWAELWRAGADRINTDHPRELAEWLAGKSSP